MFLNTVLNKERRKRLHTAALALDCVTNKSEVTRHGIYFNSIVKSSKLSFILKDVTCQKLILKDLCSSVAESRCPYSHRLNGVTVPIFSLGKKVIDVAAGSTHCLALTEDSEVHSWGSNDQCQHFDTLRVTKPEPTALPGLDSKHIVGIACGPAQVLTT